MSRYSYPNMRSLMSALILLKKNYHINNNDIAQAVGVSATTVSKWLNYKTKTCNKENKEKLENFLTETWRPALICITKFGPYPHHLFFTVGDVYNPFYTWLRYDSDEEEQLLKDYEKAVLNEETSIHIVKYYKDFNEAMDLGRQEEHQYDIGAMMGPNVKITFIDKSTPVIKESIVFDPLEENA